VSNEIDEFKRAIDAIQPLLGHLAVEFAQLEDVTTFTINALLRIDHKEGLILDTLMQNFSARIRLMTALIKLHVPAETYNPLRARGLRICSLVGQANSDRNNLLHDSWNGYSPGTKSLHKALRYDLQDGELTFIPVTNIDYELIKKTVDFVRRTTIALSQWRTHFVHRDSPEAFGPPLPDRFFQDSPLRLHIQRQKNTKAT
jgi:hypothetical protein